MVMLAAKQHAFEAQKVARIEGFVIAFYAAACLWIIPLDAIGRVADHDAAVGGDGG